MLIFLLLSYLSGFPGGSDSKEFIISIERKTCIEGFPHPSYLHASLETRMDSPVWRQWRQRLGFRVVLSLPAGFPLLLQFTVSHERARKKGKSEDSRHSGLCGWVWARLRFSVFLESWMSTPLIREMGEKALDLRSGRNIKRSASTQHMGNWDNYFTLFWKAQLFAGSGFEFLFFFPNLLESKRRKNYISWVGTPPTHQLLYAITKSSNL